VRRIAVFMGTRPEAIKMAPVVAALRGADDLEPVVVSTGQHREMLRQVVDLFEIAVDHDLDVMQPGQTLAALTGRLVVEIDRLLETVQPDLALVQGDTTTVLCGALACFYRGVPVGHVEAGLRTGNLQAPFPEEANRTLVTPLATLHFAPTATARDNLRREHVPETRIAVTGNTVIDALLMEVGRQEQPDVAGSLHDATNALLGGGDPATPFVLVTGHRRENFGAGFASICTALGTLADRFPDHRFVYPVHLNPQVREPVHAALGTRANIRLVDPVDYRMFVALMRRCSLVLTDSGGVQEEAPGLGKPVLVMRDTTERPEGIDAGTVRLVGTDADAIVSNVSTLLTDADAYRGMAEAVNPYGDGHAAPRIVDRIRAHLGAET
jgi:UDP-N-acetylglucosamine 2-epimerase (non-hydrolysing)